VLAFFNPAFGRQLLAAFPPLPPSQGVTLYLFLSQHWLAHSSKIIVFVLFCSVYLLGTRARLLLLQFANVVLNKCDHLKLFLLFVFLALERFVKALHLGREVIQALLDGCFGIIDI